jgi:uncharacterized protein YbaR (Trm112 family)/SAM-dependent methyltransferase
MVEVAVLVCPRSKLPLRGMTVEESRGVIADGRPLVGTVRNHEAPPVGETSSVLVRSDDAVAFPVVDGIPVLMWPEVLTSAEDRVSVDLDAPHYAEAYAEMAYYGDVATERLSDVNGTVRYAALRRILDASDGDGFPDPAAVWLDATYDCTAQERAFRHLAPNVKAATVVQIGGSGLQALKLLLAGAAEALLVTPVLLEARFARQLAAEVGLEERFRPLVGIGEELPLSSEAVDVVVSGGSLHHMVAGDAGREIRRVLKVGGRFGAWDPWRAPLYRLGTAVFGKREPEVGCRPIDAERAAAFLRGFGTGADHQRHGALTRYPLIALNKVGLELDVRRTLPILRQDDRLARTVPPLQRLQSSVSICAVKTDR